MIELPKLPYKRDALEPHISQRTIDFHYGQHHAGYVKNLNNLIEGSQFETMSLEEIIKKSEGSIFNNAAQVWICFETPNFLIFKRIKINNFYRISLKLIAFLLDI